MKKKTKETILIGTGLVALSLFLHYIHYLIFKDAHHTMIFLVADIAFIPMDVFFTTLILDRFLEKREKDHLLGKLNMLIGVFYTEVGTKLLLNIVEGDNDREFLSGASITNDTWKKKSFEKLHNRILKHDYNVDINKVSLEDIRKNLDENKDLLISLIANENLIEHETFTEMLMSIMHLREELNTRLSMDMQEYELEHIEKDIMLAYKYLTIEWAEYMKYLSEEYPVLYCKALINNPFDTRSKREKDKCYLKEYKKQYKDNL